MHAVSSRTIEGGAPCNPRTAAGAAELALLSAFSLGSKVLVFDDSGAERAFDKALLIMPSRCFSMLVRRSEYDA